MIIWVEFGIIPTPGKTKVTHELSMGVYLARWSRFLTKLKVS
jgi:hypothetical protein